jgi:transposase
VTQSWEFQKDLVERYLKQSKTKQEFRRALCIWLRLGLSLSTAQIAMALGMTPAAVRKFHSRYFKNGEEVLFGRGRGGRRRGYLSREREARILEKFQRQAQRGESLNTGEIQRAYELSAGRKVAVSTIYRLIDRHGMRRFLPRARRIGASEV